MANTAMESKARRVFREALAFHYIEGLEVGPEVDAWLKNHGGWLPDPQELYGDGTPLDQPKDEGDNVDSKDPARAMEDAKGLMSKLLANLTREMEHFPEDNSYKFLAEMASDWVKESDSKEVHSAILSNPREAALMSDIQDDHIKTLQDEIWALKALLQSRDKSLAEMTLRVINHEARISVLERELALKTELLAIEQRTIDALRNWADNILVASA